MTILGQGRVFTDNPLPGNQQFSPADQLCLIQEPIPELSKELPPWSLKLHGLKYLFFSPTPSAKDTSSLFGQWLRGHFFSLSYLPGYFVVLKSSDKYNQQHPGNQQFSPADQLCLIREPVPELSKELPPWSLYQLFFASRGYLSSWSSKFHLFLYLLLSSKHFLRFWLLKVFWLNRDLNRQTFQQHLQKWKTPALTTRPWGMLIFFSTYF